MINIFQPVGSSPTTTQGDLIVRGATSDARLAIGADATVLTSNGTTATWAAAAGGGLTIGTTTITSGTSTRILFDAAGVVSETDGVTWDATNKALTIGGATVTTSNPVLNLTQTWNAGAVTFTGLKLNVTDTASAAASLLMDLQVGGSTKFKIDKSGAPIITISGRGANGWDSDGRSLFINAGSIRYNYNYTSAFEFSHSCSFSNNNVTVGATGRLGFGATGNVDSNFDTTMMRVAASIMGLRDNTTGGCALSFVEQTAPSAPSANGVYIYAEDNGSGKTRLMALFNSGAAQQVAIEP